MAVSEWQPIEKADKNSKIMAYCGGRFCGNLQWDAEQYHNRPRPHWCDYGASRLWGKAWMRENQPTKFMHQPEPPK